MINNEISSIKSIGKKRSELFGKLGVFTIYDLLNFLPRGYEDRKTIKEIKDVTDGESVCIKACATTVFKSTLIRKGFSIQKVTVTDYSGVATITWFNQDWLKNSFDLNCEYVFFGKISVRNNKVEINNPVFEKATENKLTGKVIPIYPLTGGLTQKIVQSAVLSAINYVNEVPETLPGYVREKLRLCGKDYALQNVHFPTKDENLSYAITRLKFEELFYLQLGLRILKHQRRSLSGYKIENGSTVSSAFIKTLPYKLTNAQIRTINEINEDIKHEKPMNRLVQGDVGCGKTVVAAVALLTAAKNNFQSAMMAPTEILAKQHFETLSEMFQNENVTVGLLTGSTKAKEKKEIYQKIENGEIDIIVGTHALIQKEVNFKNLALVVTDEQHRFGVKQRAALAEKGNAPHMLVMTATPIPRTLALILYGDLDISAIDEMPPGRKIVETYPVLENMRERINAFMIKHLENKSQIYIVCPLVEDSESMDLKSVKTYAENLAKTVFKNYKVSLMHGKLKPKEKAEIMESFAKGETNVLVSTTVIEVGVNVPNASIMIIEDAERFGLSQLHQLRGRVGRGNKQSYCIMFYKGSNDITKERMKIMKETNNGFIIAEKDLSLRGPGEFFGTNQHGLPEMKIANLYKDINILKSAGEFADKILEKDSTLSLPENEYIKNTLVKIFENVDIFEFN